MHFRGSFSLNYITSEHGDLRWLLKKFQIKFFLGWKETTKILKLVFPFTRSVMDSSHAYPSDRKDVRTVLLQQESRLAFPDSASDLRVRAESLSIASMCWYILALFTVQFCFWKICLDLTVPLNTTSQKFWANMEKVPQFMFFPTQNCHIWMSF